MGSRRRLVVVQSDPVLTDGRRLRIAAKTLAGLRRYAREWPGETVLVARPAPAGTTPTPLHETLRPADLPFAVDVRERPEESAARDDHAITLAFHQLDSVPLLRRDPSSVVLFGEFPLSERIRIGGLDAPALTRARVAAGWLRHRRTLREMVRAAGGFQANGYPAHDAYAALSRRAMLYFDTRMTAPLMDLGASSRGPGRPLRLGFSGRHVAAKGADHAVRAAVAAASRGLDLTLDVFGSGGMTPALRELAAPLGERVRFWGDVPFDDAWVRAVADGIDVMVLPHRQGDPSGTYLESAALGVPVAGYANRALAALVERHGIGWTVPMDDVDALAGLLVRCGARREEITRAGEAGRRLVRAHLFPAEFSRRVEHLRSVADV